jgi:hypothetical protein
MTSYPHPPPRADLRYIGVDLDGTLAEPIWTADNPVAEIGPPIWRNIVKLREAQAAGYKIVIHTSRADHDREAIEAWLSYYCIGVERIETGKPLCLLYVDDRGRHSDAGSWLP